MSKSEEHILLGALFGFGAYVAAKRAQGEDVNWGNAIGWGVAGAGVATLPDFIEPANGPNHRSFAHSLVTGGTLICAMKKVWENSNLNSEQKARASALIAAYLSHLIADSTTPAGIPIV